MKDGQCLILLHGADICRSCVDVIKSVKLFPSHATPRQTVHNRTPKEPMNQFLGRSAARTLEGSAARLSTTGFATTYKLKGNHSSLARPRLPVDDSVPGLTRHPKNRGYILSLDSFILRYRFCPHRPAMLIGRQDLRNLISAFRDEEANF